MYEILMEVHYITKPGMRKSFLEAVTPYANLSKAEEGNYGYDYYLNPNDDNDLLLIEKWQNQEILDKHFKMEHFAKIGEIKTKYVDDTKITKHYVEIK